ncbi:MAG TPA: hypothetical protein VF228_06105 [Iamia sp.]
MTNALNTGVPPLTHGGVIAQVWRGGHGRQARVAQALKGVTVEPLDDELGRAAGILLARAGMTDAIDAAVVSLAEDGDRILTSDPVAIDRLVEAAGLDVEVVPV